VWTSGSSKLTVCGAEYTVTFDLGTGCDLPCLTLTGVTGSGSGSHAISLASRPLKKAVSVDSWI
jgi:hypothetical protein